MHSTCRKDPNSTESAEEAALKASGPMPCALLIVTRAFLPSNSDWWARRGGLGILQRRQGASGGEKLCVKVPSLLSEGWHGASGDAGGAFGALSLDTGLVSPLPCTTRQQPPHYPYSCNVPPTNTPQPPHLICSLLSAWPQWTGLLLWHRAPSWHLWFYSFESIVWMFTRLEVIVKNSKV